VLRPGGQGIVRNTEPELCAQTVLSAVQTYSVLVAIRTCKIVHRSILEEGCSL
jgi:hypothetical protein